MRLPIDFVILTVLIFAGHSGASMWLVPLGAVIVTSFYIRRGMDVYAHIEHAKPLWLVRVHLLLWEMFWCSVTYGVGVAFQRWW